jgi:hypothetical protein
MQGKEGERGEERERKVDSTSSLVFSPGLLQTFPDAAGLLAIMPEQ